jgi:anti-anti-sigma regulatory factor
MSEILAATIDGTLFVKVVGRGTMKESEPLYKVALDKLRSEARSVAFDLSECTYLDSTFLGVIAAISKKVYSLTRSFATLLKVSTAAAEHLRTTGMMRILDCGGEDMCQKPLPILSPVVREAGGNVGKSEMTVHVLMAHRNLMDLCDENQERFKNVVEMLTRSMEKRERGI